MRVSCCRFCNTELTRTFVDLGRSPLANSFLTADTVNKMEPFFPLHAYLCERCLLVQLESVEARENIFSDYLYFSSYSETWLEHCRAYAGSMIERFKLGSNSLVVEIASNDGYLLQHFRARHVPVLGIEPAENVARVAVAKGIRTEAAFFGVATAERLAAQGMSADLMPANNVLAHVPDINDFVAGFKILLKHDGVATFEFPHLLRLIREHQFDTIYHEHFSYLSLGVAEKIFTHHGLRVFDVEQLSTHGGSLRVYVCHGDAKHRRTERCAEILSAEHAAQLDGLDGYTDFAAAVVETKCRLLEFLIAARRSGKVVAGYGAPAKGNTLLNYCGVGPELIPYTVDLNPHKQGCFLPGVQIPIFPPERIFETKPDYVLILPWNLRDEISRQMAKVREWGGRFVVAIPTTTILQ